MKKKLAATLSVVLILGLAVLGILAYLTDTDNDVNVMTLGNVDIEQIEQERGENGEFQEFTGNNKDAEGNEVEEEGKPLFPATPGYKDNLGVDGLWHNENNAVDKIVSVNNKGKSEAYVRTWFAFEYGNKDAFDKIHINKNEKDWEWSEGEVIEIDDEDYYVVYAVYKEALAPGVTTEPSLKQVALDTEATNEDVEVFGDTYVIKVFTQAGQTAGFESGVTTFAFEEGTVAIANEALIVMFGEEHPWGMDYIFNEETPDEEIAAAFAEGGKIYFEESIELTNSGTGSADINVDSDVEIYADDNVKLTFGKTTLFKGDGSVTVYSGNLDAVQELCVTGNTELVIKGGEHTFGAFSATSNGKIVVDGGVLNCKGTYAGVLGISFAQNGQLVVNGGTLNMYQPFNLNANRCDNAYVEINDGTINLLNDTDKLFAVRNIMDKDRTSGVLRGSSIRINGGTFTTEYQIDSTGDANAFIRNEDGNADTTRVLESNIYNGEKQYDCSVTGGTFYGNWMRTGETGGDGTEVCENTIAGFVAAGYKMTGDSVNGYVVTAE